MEKRASVETSDVGPSSVTPRPTLDTPRPTESKSIEVGRKESSSKKKLSPYLHDYKHYLKDCNPNDINDIVNLNSLQSLLAQVAVRAQCQGPLNIATSNRVGLFMKITITCNDCGYTASENNSNTLPTYQIKKRTRPHWQFKICGLIPNLLVLVSRPY